MFRLLLHALVSLTWSERPVWISPPLRRTRFRKGRFVKRLWLAKTLRRGKIGRCCVGLGGIDISYISDRTSDQLIDTQVYRAEDCQELLVNDLGLPSVSEFDRPDLEGPTLRLDLAITELKPGYALLRLFDWNLSPGPLAWFGFGHAWVQIEGVIGHHPGDAPLIKFVHRRRNSGLRTVELIGIPRWTGLSTSLVGLLISRMAHEILMELDQHLNRPR